MDKAQLAHLIHQLFQASQAQDRQIIEQKLNELEENKDQHLHDVIQLIVDQENPEIAQVRLSIAVYLRNYVRKILNDSSTQGLQTAYLQHLIGILYPLLVAEGVEFNVKKHIFLIFESLLVIYQSTETNLTNLQDFYGNLFSQFQTLIASPNPDVTKGALLLCQAALQSIRNSNFLAKVFTGLSNLLCKLAEHYIQLLTKDLMVISAGTQLDLSLENPQIQSILRSLDLVQEWANIHESILERWESRKHFGFNLIANNIQYPAIFAQILGISVQSAPQMMKSFISLTGLQKLDHLLNQIKIKTLECLNHIYRYLFEMITTAAKKESPFLAKAVLMCPFFVSSLIDIAQRPNIEQLIEDESYHDIISEAIESLTLFVGEKEFYDHMSKFSRSVLVQVCLTLLRTTRPELDQMVKDPDSFVNLALDTCDKQKSKIVKTQAAKLLEAICDNIDGAVSFITYFCCQSLSLALDPSKPAIQEPFYSQEYLLYKDSLFLASSPEIIGETCLVALTAISYILPRRQDLVPIFEEILAKNIDQILHKGSILLRVRMSLLLGYYADMLFEKYREAFIKTIDFLIQSVALHGDQKVIALQSADTLNTIISDKDLIPRLEPELPRLIGVLNECNLKIQIKLYFNFLLDFVKYYHHAIGSDIIAFTKSLVQRILIELKSCHEKGEKNNLIINKCWNIIRQIIEIEDFVPTYYEQIENEMKPLFEFTVDPQKIEFEDDIILALKTFIKKSGIVSPTLWTIFPHLVKVFEKGKHTFGNLLDTINYYMLFGKTEIAIQREYLTTIINMAKASLFSMEPNITIQNSEGAILFQLLFQIYADPQSNVLDEYFDDILSVVVKRMNSSPMADHLKRHLLCVFLAAMIYNPNYALIYSEKNNFTQELFTQLFMLSSSFTNFYERKLFIIGLSNVLNANQLPPSLASHLLDIIQQIIQMLNNLKQAEAKALKKVGKKEIKDDDDEDDEDSDDDEEDNEEEDNENEEEETKGEPTIVDQDLKDTDEELKDEGKVTEEESESEEENDIDEVFDLNVTMDLLNAPVKKSDEFSIFRTILQTLHSKDPAYINNLFAQLNEDEKKFLKEHIETKRIKIEHKGIETEVARRIIKVKRRGGVGSGMSGSEQK